MLFYCLQSDVTSGGGAVTTKMRSGTRHVHVRMAKTAASVLYPTGLDGLMSLAVYFFSFAFFSSRPISLHLPVAHFNLSISPYGLAS